MGEGMPPLFQAIVVQDHARIRQLVQAGQSLSESWCQMPPLSFAVAVWRQGQDTEAQKIEVVRTLIDAGAPLHLTNALGATALDDAVMGGKTKLAAFLHQKGVPAGMTMGPADLSNDALNRLTGGQLLTPERIAELAAGRSAAPKAEQDASGACGCVGCLALVVICVIVNGSSFLVEKLHPLPSPSQIVVASPETTALENLAKAREALARKDFYGALASADVAVSIARKTPPTATPSPHGGGLLVDSLSCRAEIYEKLKNREKAISDYEELQKLQPANPKIKERLATCRKMPK